MNRNSVFTLCRTAEEENKEQGWHFKSVSVFFSAVGLICPRAEGTLMEVLRQVQAGVGGGEELPAPTRISLK